VVVFVLLVLVCLVLFGFACACLTDQPAQALERAMAALAHLPAVMVVWTFLSLLLGVGLASTWLAASSRPFGRASPALLQRFLF